MTIIEHPARQAALDAASAREHAAEVADDIRAIFQVSAGLLDNVLVPRMGEVVGRSAGTFIQVSAALAYVQYVAMQSGTDPRLGWELFKQLGDEIAAAEFPANAH